MRKSKFLNSKKRIKKNQKDVNDVIFIGNCQIITISGTEQSVIAKTRAQCF